MAITKLSDVVNAASMQAFTAFVKKAYLDSSAFIKSGIAASDPVISARCAAAGFGGKTVNLPFWGDLDGDDEVIADAGSDGGDTTLAIAKLSAGQDVAVITRRAKAFGVTDLAVDLAGDDPMAWIASRIGAYWARRDEAKLLKTLAGVFGKSTTGTGSDVSYAGDDLTLDLSSETLGKTTLLTAAQLLGDRKAALTGLAMNSAAETALSSIDAQSTLYRPSDAKGTLPTYNGRAIVMDDNLGYDASTKVAEIYLFGAGAVALDEVPSKVPFETGRDPLKNGGQDFVVSRHAGIAHVRGIAWQGTAAGASPTNDELAKPANWKKVYDTKDIRVVKLLVKIA